MGQSTEYVENERTLFLKRACGKLFWWDIAPAPERILAQVMYLGELQDVVEMEALFSQEELKLVLKSMEPGWMDERSRHFWHYRLFPGEELPPRPQRSFL